MKVSAINNVSRCSHFKSAVQNTNTTTQPQNNNKKNLALAALAVLGIAAVGIAISKKNINVSNILPKSKRRDAKALERYRYDETTRKMASLNKRFLSGEFDQKPQKVMEQIQQNELMFEHKLGILRKK